MLRQINKYIKRTMNIISFMATIIIVLAAYYIDNQYGKRYKS